jgi:hypothetical protein
MPVVYGLGETSRSDTAKPCCIGTDACFRDGHSIISAVDRQSFITIVVHSKLKSMRGFLAAMTAELQLLCSVLIEAHDSD